MDLGRPTAGEQEGAVARSNEQLLARRRVGEAAGSAVKPSEYRRMASGDEVSF
jgi:hypothetical protein